MKPNFASIAEERMQERQLIPLPTEGFGHHSAIFADPKMEEVIRSANLVAKHKTGVLLLGESGSGKEVIARHIHRNSQRAKGPFLPVNCPTLAATLLESELFGHEKGAYTGANKRHIGSFERANGGTLFLDEISEVSLETQAKLLRVIQEHTIVRVGGTEPIELDIRIIAATNRDLAECVRKGTFREDLFYRLNMFSIQIPPLRERPRDMGIISTYLLGKLVQESASPLRFIHPTTMDKLKAFHFPGNVRQLRNILEKAMILAMDSEVLLPEHIHFQSSIITPAPPKPDPHFATAPSTASTTESDSQSIGEDSLSVIDATHKGESKNSEFEDVVIYRPSELSSWREIERQVILSTLRYYDYNRTRTAEALGLSLRTVRNRVNAFRDEGYKVDSENEVS